MFKKNISLLLLIFIAFKAFAVPFTDKGTSSFQQVYNSCVKVADINNDTLPDIFLSGTDGTSAYSRVYLNTGNYTFTPLPVSIPDLNNTKIDFCDFNNDGFVDLAISGVTDAFEYKCSIYKNNGDNTFSEVASPVENMAYGSVLWADFDNDGKPDLYVTGINQSGTRVAHIYKNVNNSFILVPATIAGISDGAAVILDYNKDGKPDILVTGTNSSGQNTTLLYKNKGNFVFESVNNIFEKITGGDMASGDIDSDGDDDVIITGNNALGKHVTKLYLNNSSIFVEAPSAVFDSLSNGSVDMADINNDGRLDILLTGQDNDLFYRTTLYINNGDNTFHKDPAFFPGLLMSDAGLADFNKDYKTDILLSGKTYTGNISKIYSNDTAYANKKPSPPTGLTAVSKDDSVVLNWNKATDTETSQNGLIYNVYVGTQSGKCDIVSPMAFIPVGIRKVIGSGNNFHSTSMTLHNLPEGHYYWGVQSIDNCYAGSKFSIEGTFTVCHNLNIGNDTSACYGDTIHLSAGKTGDVVNWYSVKHGLLLNNSKTLDYRVSENDQVVAEVTNSLGCTLRDTLAANVISLPSFNLGKDTSICKNSNILLNAGNGWTAVNWYSFRNGLLASDTSRYVHIVLNNDTLFAEVTSNAGCTNFDSIFIAKLDLPSFSLGSDLNVCFNNQAVLNTSPSFTNTKWYSIQNTLLFSGGPGYSYTVKNTDTIYAEVTDANNCKNRDTVIVNKLTLPLIDIGHDTSVCYNNQLNLHAVTDPGHTNWFSKNNGTIASDTTSVNVSVLANDSIRAIITDANGCVNKDTLVLIELGLPTFSIGNDTSVCMLSNVLLIAGTGWKNVNWYDRSSGLLHAGSWYYNHEVTKSDTIWAVVTDHNNCVNNDSINIVSLSLPDFNIGNDTAICKNQIIRLNSGDGWNNTNWYSKNTGLLLAGNHLLSYRSVMSDTVWAVVTDNHSCVNNDTIVIVAHELPYLNFTPDTSICENENLSLSAGNGWKNVNWYSTRYGLIYTNTSSINRNMVYNDTLFAVVTDNNNCINSDSTIVHVAALPSVNLGADTSICLNNNIVFQVLDSLYDVKWYSISEGFISSGNKILVYQPVKTDNLAAEVFSNAGCKSSDTIVVVVHPLPVINAGTDTMLCYGINHILGGNPTASGSTGNYNYFWTPGTGLDNSHASNPSLTANSDITYYLKVEDSNRCEAYDSIKVSVNPPSRISLTSEINVCFGKSVKLGNSDIITGSLFPYTYQWSPDSTLDDPAIANPIAMPSLRTRYRLVAQTLYCNPDTAYINVVVKPLPSVHVSPTLTIGKDGSVELYAEGGSEYLWNPTDKLDHDDVPNPIARPDKSTLYTVAVTDSLGCSSEATVQVNVNNEVFVPNLFTPNNDGKNDYFKIYGFGFRELTLKIIDRQNIIVFESIDIDEITQKGWDGTYKGKPLKSGIYEWILGGYYLSGEPVLYKGKNSGVITLIR